MAQETKKTKRGNRYRLFDDGTGDYRIYRIGTPDQDLPAGTLLQIPGVPGFESTKEALAYIKQAPETFQGMQVMILRGMEILSIEVQSKPLLNVQAKPKTLIGGENADSE